MWGWAGVYRSVGLCGELMTVMQNLPFGSLSFPRRRPSTTPQAKCLLDSNQLEYRFRGILLLGGVNIDSVGEVLGSYFSNRWMDGWLTE